MVIDSWCKYAVPSALFIKILWLKTTLSVDDPDRTQYLHPFNAQTPNQEIGLFYTIPCPSIYHARPWTSLNIASSKGEYLR